MKRWYDNWDAITPIFKFSPDVGKVIYTTNTIESLNSTYRKFNRQRSVFPSDTALLKVLYLATFEATKKWTMSIRNWDGSTVNSALCMRDDSQNNRIYMHDYPCRNLCGKQSDVSCRKSNRLYRFDLCLLATAHHLCRKNQTIERT